MITATRGAKFVAVSAAALTHGALALLFISPQAEVNLESATGVATARLGSGFADLVASVQAPQTPQSSAEKPQTSEILEPLSPNAAAKPLPPDATPPLKPDISLAPVPPVEPLLPIQPTPQPSPLTKTTAVVPAVAAAPPPVSPIAPSPIETSPPQPVRPVTQPTTIAETLTAEPDDLSSSPKTSLRPHARPPKAVATQKKPAPRPAPQTRPQAQPGNADSNQRAGAETGTKTTTAVTKTGSGQKASQGNAAASNYPGQVLRRISRVRRPKVRARGVTFVSFSIATNGSLASVRIGKSSGSAQLDNAAVQIIRRAAPFKPPPVGAKRAFVIPIKGG